MDFSKDWSIYALVSLPMGLRVSVSVACAVTWALLDFEKGDVRVTSYVDNVRMIGETSAVHAAMIKFVQGADISEHYWTTCPPAFEKYKT